MPCPTASGGIIRRCVSQPLRRTRMQIPNQQQFPHDPRIVSARHGESRETKRPENKKKRTPLRWHAWHWRGRERLRPGEETTYRSKKKKHRDKREIRTRAPLQTEIRKHVLHLLIIQVDPGPAIGVDRGRKFVSRKPRTHLLHPDDAATHPKLQIQLLARRTQCFHPSKPDN